MDKLKIICSLTIYFFAQNVRRLKSIAHINIILQIVGAIDVLSVIWEVPTTRCLNSWSALEDILFLFFMHINIFIAYKHSSIYVYLLSKLTLVSFFINLSIVYRLVLHQKRQLMYFLPVLR